MFFLLLRSFKNRTNIANDNAPREAPIQAPTAGTFPLSDLPQDSVETVELVCCTVVTVVVRDEVEVAEEVVDDAESVSNLMATPGVISRTVPLVLLHVTSVSFPHH